MTTTRVDRFGRILIPKPVRERFGLEAGTEVIIEGDREGLRLKLAGEEPSIAEKDGILVYRGTTREDLEKAAKRQRRLRLASLR